MQGQEDAAQTQKTLLQNLAQMPGRPQPEEGQPVPPAQAVPPTDWTQILSLIASGMTEAQRLALDAEVKKRDLDRRIEELEKKLARAGARPRRADRGEGFRRRRRAARSRSDGALPGAQCQLDAAL